VQVDTEWHCCPFAPVNGRFIIKEMVMTNIKSVYLTGCGLCRWRLNCIRSLNPMIDGIYKMRKYGVKITLHMGHPFGDFDLRM